MRSFKEQQELDIDNVFMNTDEFAETVIYDNKTTQVEIDAIVTFGEDGKQKYEGDHASIQVKKADVPNPAYGHSFIIGGQEFKIAKDSNRDNIVPLDDYTWQIKITANERFEGWRQ